MVELKQLDDLRIWVGSAGCFLDLLLDFVQLSGRFQGQASAWHSVSTDNLKDDWFHGDVNEV